MSNAALLIRAARGGDAPLLCDAERQTARIPGRLVSCPDELEEISFARTIEALAAEGSYLVAERDGCVVGHAMLDRVAPLRALDHVRSLTLVVHPGCTRQGVGRALLNALLDWARASRVVRRIELRVREGNAPAIALYEKSGFVEECRLRKRIMLPDGRCIDDIGMAWLKDGVA